jgi:hypothetical protein
MPLARINVITSVASLLSHFTFRLADEVSMLHLQPNFMHQKSHSAQPLCCFAKRMFTAVHLALLSLLY